MREFSKVSRRRILVVTDEIFVILDERWGFKFCDHIHIILYSSSVILSLDDIFLKNMTVRTAARLLQGIFEYHTVLLLKCCFGAFLINLNDLWYALQHQISIFIIDSYDIKTCYCLSYQGL